MKWLICFVFSLKLICAVAEGPSMLLSTAIRLNKIVVLYPIGVKSERDMNLCQERSACNVIHNRFWLPPVIERLCRCPHRNECPWTWSAPEDSQTISLNNRSQMKFCKDLSLLSNCTAKTPAITISSILVSSAESIPESKNHSIRMNNGKLNKNTQPRNVTILCNCQEPHYWKMKVNSTTLDFENNYIQRTYYCSKLKKCAKLDFCGHVRQDTHSTFYRCSCPRGYLCITKNKTVLHAEEMLFSGESYKAYCLSHAEESRKH